MCTVNLNRRQVLRLVPGLVLASGLGACSDKGTGPATVRWGKEYCDYCGMIVDDPRFAAQIREKPGAKVYKFDDLGDGVLWLLKQPWADSSQVEFWVGDVEKGTWIDGRIAWYLSGMRSPMAHNLGAVPDRRPGAVDFAEMKKLVVAQGTNSRCETPTEGTS